MKRKIFGISTFLLAFLILFYIFYNNLMNINFVMMEVSNEKTINGNFRLYFDDGYGYKEYNICDGISLDYNYFRDIYYFDFSNIGSFVINGMDRGVQKIIMK